MIQKIKKYQFLFEELVKRDFKKKYKGTMFGMLWSILSPLLQLFVLYIIFNNFFGQTIEHFIIFLFAGQVVYSYFSEATTVGMNSLMENASIFSKVNVPKYLFLLSKNVSSLINFAMTLGVFFVLCAYDGVTFTWKFILLVYPVTLLIFFNIGMGLILSALLVFFRDIQYLYNVFISTFVYLCAVFYTIDTFDPIIQNAFLLNPIYLFIRYIRKIVLDGVIPTIWFHLLMLAEVLVVLLLGAYTYKKYNNKFLYYI